MGGYEEFFKFAAKAGALEGYLYQRDKVEPLANWVNNIEKLYKNLPEDVKEDIKGEYSSVLRKILMHGEKVLTHEIRLKLNNMLSEL